MENKNNIIKTLKNELKNGKHNNDVNSIIEKSINSLENNNCNCKCKCNMKRLNRITDGFTKINGSVPPAEYLPTQNPIILLNTINANGDRVLMVKATRKAGTRVGIHVHKYGGYTIILSGTMTDFVQGQPNREYGPNTCYYMPPCTPMAAANLGDEDVELIDIFIGKPSEPFIQIKEPAWPYKRVGRFDPVPC